VRILIFLGLGLMLKKRPRKTNIQPENSRRNNWQGMKKAGVCPDWRSQELLRSKSR
jgi:hypothetical protein